MKNKQLKLYGHVKRISENRVAKMLYELVNWI